MKKGDNEKYKDKLNSSCYGEYGNLWYDYQQISLPNSFTISTHDYVFRIIWFKYLFKNDTLSNAVYLESRTHLSMHH